MRLTRTYKTKSYVFVELLSRMKFCCDSNCATCILDTTSPACSVFLFFPFIRMYQNRMKTLIQMYLDISQSDPCCVDSEAIKDSCLCENPPCLFIDSDPTCEYGILGTNQVVCCSGGELCKAPGGHEVCDNLAGCVGNETVAQIHFPNHLICLICLK